MRSRKIWRRSCLPFRKKHSRKCSKAGRNIGSGVLLAKETTWRQQTWISCIYQHTVFITTVRSFIDHTSYKIFSLLFHQMKLEYIYVCVTYLSPGDIAKAALEWNPQGTRLQGRSRTTWRRTILKEIRHQGKTWKEVKVLARNHVRWQNFVRALCSLEEWWETIINVFKLYLVGSNRYIFMHLACKHYCNCNHHLSEWNTQNVFYLHNSTFLQCTNKTVPARFEVLTAESLRFISSGILHCHFDMQRTVHRDIFL